MSLFDQMSGADVQSRGSKITEPALGEHIVLVVRLDDIKLQDSNRGDGTLFIPEFTVIEGTEKTKAGNQYGWVQKPTRRPQTDPANIKSFVAACLGVDPQDDIPASVFEEATQGRFNGTILRLKVEHVQTKAGFDFMAHYWDAMPDDYVPPTATDAPKAPTVPSVPAPPVTVELTKEAWLAGEGPGATHPNNPEYEWNPQHADWGVRSKA